MKNNYNNIFYVIVLVIICFLVLKNGQVGSRGFLYSARNEIIPLASSDNMGDEWILAELFPTHGSGQHYICDYHDENSIISYVDGSTPIDANYAMDVQSDELLEDEIKEGVIDNSSNAIQQLGEENSVNNTTNEIQDNQVIDAISVDSSDMYSNVGIEYSMEQLSNFEFLIGNCYTVDGSTSITSQDININTMLAEDLSLDLTGDDYKILIYHTHGSETFIDSRPGVIEDSIIGVGDELTRILEEDYGIKTYHDRTVYDMVDGKLDRNEAYTQSGYGIDKILAEYPSIEVVLDIHRDGVRDDVHLMKVIDGKPTAQIMFFNGVSRLNEEGDLGYLHNPNLSSNLSFSLQMHLKGKSLYGDLMRKIYVGGYCYNLDRKPRASLVEVGAQTNTVEEAKNAMSPLAAILYSILSGN